MAGCRFWGNALAAACVATAAWIALPGSVTTALADPVVDSAELIDTTATIEADPPVFVPSVTLIATDDPGAGTPPAQGGAANTFDHSHFNQKIATYRAERAQLLADQATLSQKYLALQEESRQWQSRAHQYNQDAAALNLEEAPFRRDDAALTADILAHNAAVAAGRASPVQAAALRARKAALDARAAQHNFKKIQLDTRANTLRAQQESINARVLQQRTQALQLQQRAQQLATRAAAFATELGNALRPLPTGGRADIMAEKITALKLSQTEAAQVTNTASKGVFGETSGIAKLPDGRMVILPKLLTQRDAMIVLPNGVVTVLRNVDLNEFTKYLVR